MFNFNFTLFTLYGLLVYAFIVVPKVIICNNDGPSMLVQVVIEDLRFGIEVPYALIIK